MDSGLDVNYNLSSKGEAGSHLISREISVMESSSTIRSSVRARREITNPYLQPTRTPQVYLYSRDWYFSNFGF